MRAWCALLLGAGVLVGCGPADDVDVCSGIELAHAVLVLETNHGSASALGRLEMDGCYRSEPDLALGADPALAEAHGKIFVVVRDQGVIREVSREGLAFTAAHDVATPGELDPNPWDVDVDAQGRLWVARYGLGGVAVVDTAGSVTVADLSSLDPSDGSPEASAIRVVGDRAYVALQRLQPESYPDATLPGVIAVIDRETFTVVDAFELGGKNPFSMTPVAGAPEGVVSIALAGDHEGIDEGDGLVRVDLATGEVRSVISEIAVDGSVVDAVIAGDNEAYAIVSGPEPGLNPTRVVAFDPATGVVAATLADTRNDEPGFYHAGLALNGPHLLVGDRTPGKARLRVFVRATGHELGAIPSGSYPPWELVTLTP